jgi:hypothetical protein
MNRPESGKPRFLARFTHCSLPKVFLWTTGALAAIIAVLFIASYFLDEPLRRYTENKLNRDLKGYSVRLPSAHFQLVGLTMTLRGLTVLQDAHPDPPVVVFPVIRAGIHWREIFSRRLVAEFRLDRPKLNINLQQLRAEAAGKVPLKKRGWQQAVEDIYPLKINLLKINDGELSYIDQDPKKPLRLSRVNLQAGNIRNIRLPDNVYPSSFHMETDIFGTGHGVVAGRANFLAEPYPGANAVFRLEKVPLDFFAPVVARSNLTLRNGLFSAVGEVEYAPNTKTARISEMTIRGLEIHYKHTSRTAAAEKRRAEKVGEAARKLGKSRMLVRLDRLRLSESTVGMVNEGTAHPYRVFLTDADLLLTNLSNRGTLGPAEARLRGKFMGSGATSVTSRFRPGAKEPVLDLDIRIEDTRMKDMNDLLRAYGNFDVTGGYFSFYSELHIKDDAVSGYVKPFFRDIKVYDRRTDREKGLFRQMYEIMVGGIAKFLESGETGEVATKAEISGQVHEPQVSTWQIVGRLIQNAFFKAILPGFDKEVSRLRQR